MFSIIVVCTANICRSPAAAVLLTSALNQSKVAINSAGTMALDGNDVDPNIIKLLSEKGFPQIATHRSRALMPSAIQRNELILCAEHRHVEWIERKNPAARGKTFLLSRWHDNSDVPDPYGKSEREYLMVLEKIQQFSIEWATKIIDLGILK